MVAQAVQRLTPIDVTATGMLVLSYAAADDTWAQAVESAKDDVLAAVQICVEGVTALTLRTHATAAASDTPSTARPTRRLTAEDVQQERLEQMMGRDPLLAAAVRALDLELRD
jgi:DNA polymerase-3 subunit gamma/tau